MLSKAEIDGATWYSVGPPSGRGAILYREDAHGVWMRGFWDAQQMVHTPRLVYTDSLHVEHPFAAGFSVALTRRDTVVQVPAGALTAWKYRRRWTHLQGSYTLPNPVDVHTYLAPGVGFVRIDCGYLSMDASRQATVQGAYQQVLLRFEPAGS